MMRTLLKLCKCWLLSHQASVNVLMSADCTCGVVLVCLTVCMHQSLVGYYVHVSTDMCSGNSDMAEAATGRRRQINVYGFAAHQPDVMRYLLRNKILADITKGRYYFPCNCCILIT